MPSVGSCPLFRQMYTFDIIVPYAELGPIIYHQVTAIEGFSCFGEVPELERATVPGFDGQMLIQKIQEVSGGRATEIMRRLLSMSFEVVLISPICLDGLTSIQFLLRRKDPVSRSPVRPLWSPLIYRQSYGTQN
jgi:hypothetical protein